MVGGKSVSVKCSDGRRYDQGLAKLTFRGFSTMLRATDWRREPESASSEILGESSS